MPDEAVIDVLRRLDPMAMEAVSLAAAQQLDERLFALGALAPGDMTSYQFTAITHYEFVGNGVMWSTPASIVWTFGTESDKAQIGVNPAGGYVFGDDQISHDYTRTVARLFVLLAEQHLRRIVSTRSELETEWRIEAPLLMEWAELTGREL